MTHIQKLLFLILITFGTNAFGSVVWSSAGYASGEYTATLKNSYNSPKLTETGSCDSNPSLAVMKCQVSALGGSSYVGPNFDTITQWPVDEFYLDGKTNMLVFGSLIVPGAGFTEIQFDISYEWGVVPIASMWDSVPPAPSLTVGGLATPIDFRLTSEAFGSETGYVAKVFSGRAVASIERGTPIPFDLSFKNTLVFSGFQPEGTFVRSSFSLDGLTEVPEPFSIILTASGLLMVVGIWKKRGRKGAATGALPLTAVL